MQNESLLGGRPSLLGGGRAVAGAAFEEAVAGELVGVPLPPPDPPDDSDPPSIALTECRGDGTGLPCGVPLIETSLSCLQAKKIKDYNPIKPRATNLAIILS